MIIKEEKYHMIEIGHKWDQGAHEMEWFLWHTWSAMILIKSSVEEY
jgi:hypothetical protein